MGGGSGDVIIKNLKAAAQLSITPNGKWKVWHLLFVTHLIVFIAGALVF